jgi:putative ABC transport system substrate-binding protein
MIKRREFIAGLGSAVAWPLAARAQQADRMRRIGVLMSFEENDPEGKRRYSAFTQALADLGWTDSRNVRTDVRWPGDDINRIRAFAQELVGLQPDIILTATTPATVAVQRETRTIPNVFASVTDPVASGIVPRLDRPGGNVTGFASYEGPLGGKWLELLSEIAPGLKRAAIMFDPDTFPVSTFMPSFETAARSLKVELIIAPAHSDGEIETAITVLGREPGGGFVVIPGAFTNVHRVPIISAAARNNVPAVYASAGVPQRPKRIRICRGSQCGDRISLGGGPKRSSAGNGRRIGRSSCACDCGEYSSGVGVEGGDQYDSRCFRHCWRPSRAWTRELPVPSTSSGLSASNNAARAFLGAEFAPCLHRDEIVPMRRVPAARSSQRGMFGAGGS